MRWNRSGYRDIGIWAKRRERDEIPPKIRLNVVWKIRYLRVRRKVIWRPNRGVVVCMMKGLTEGIQCQIRFRIRRVRRGEVRLRRIRQRRIIWEDRKSRGF